MKELEYPFDAAYIIKKRKSLKKALLADGTSRIRKRIAVFGGSTTSPAVMQSCRTEERTISHVSSEA